MILGASHITLACGDIADAAADLLQIGYQVVFTEPALPSDPGKTPLLSTPRNVHTIAFTRAAQGLPIELVFYDVSIPEPCGRFVGLFAVPIATDAKGDPASARLADVAAEAYDCDVAPGVLPGFDVPAVFAQSGSEQGGLRAAVLCVDDLDRSSRLWSSGLGFRQTKTGDRWAQLDFAAPIPAWRFSIVLVGWGRGISTPSLDGRGMTCLSFVCTNLERDRQALIDHGAFGVMSPFHSRVNGKNLSVEVLRGTDGEFIELIQICR